jgi:hypothetical protein
MKSDKSAFVTAQQFSELDHINKNLKLLELPAVVASISNMIEQLNAKHDAIQEYMIKLNQKHELGDRYMTPQDAMEYLGFSRGTFEKYRYNTKIKIKGYPLDGKTWFKKSDLDMFMLTYQAKSGCLA